jgi:hypothetical protein
VDGPPTISPADESAAAVNLSALDDTSNIGHFIRPVNPSEVSQVRDANGEPLPVFHAGTFKPDKDIPVDMHFGTRAAAEERGRDYDETFDKVAKELGQPRTSTILTTAAFLSIKNPKTSQDMIDWTGAIKQGKKEGYDGILYTNTAEDAGSTSYLPFSPTQIKSATDNAGTYGNENPSVLFQDDADTQDVADDLQAEKPHYKANAPKNADWLLNTDPVTEIPENAVKLDSLEGKNFVDKIYNLFVRDKVTQVMRGEWKINLSKSGVRSSRRKGLGTVKINAFAAIPEIITKGIITDVNRNWKGRGYDSYFINAPVKIGDTEYIVEVIVNRGKDGTGNFYLHEVEKKSKLRGVQQSGMDTRTPEGASKLNIAHLLKESNTEKSSPDPLLPGRGRPGGLYAE